MLQQLLEALLLLIPMILSLSVHEYAHARVAWALGDRTAESMGRMTLNPAAHIDPIGTIILPMLGFLFGGLLFGWARPVPVNPLAFTRRISMKKGMLLVAAAGPLSNFLLALIAAAVFAGLVFSGVADTALIRIFSLFVQLNVTLAFFNLIPIPPLDGGRILAGLLPARYDGVMTHIERYGFVLVLVLLMTNALNILFVPASALSRFLLTWPTLFLTFGY